MPEFLTHPAVKYTVLAVIGVALVHRLGITAIDPATYIPELAPIEDAIAYPENLLGGGFALPAMDSYESSFPSSDTSSFPLPPVPNSAGEALPPAPSSGGSCDRGPSAHASGTVNNGVYTVAPGDTQYSLIKRFEGCANVPAPQNLIIGTTFPVQ